MYDLKQLAQIADGKLIGENLCNDWLLMIDSRHLINAEISIFFALKSPFNDGALFIQELIEKGVKAFVVDTLFDCQRFNSASFIVVESPLFAMQKMAQFHRSQIDKPIVGITGSNGKTIVKEWLKYLFNHAMNVCASPKSFNSQIGVPLSVWRLKETHDIAFFEAGISTQNEMQGLEKMIQPQYGILTNIGAAHDAGFKNREEKTEEKLKLFVNVKMVFTSETNKKNIQFHQRVAFWARNNEAADFNILSIEKTQDQTFIKGKYKNQDIDFKIPFTDNVSIENSALCALVCLYFNVFEAQIFETLPVLSMRQEIKKGQRNCILVNDSYSNDIDALSAALSFLQKQTIHPNNTAILSDIEQSGASDDEICHQICVLVQEKNIQKMIGIGKVLCSHQAMFQKAGIQIQCFETTQLFLEQFDFNTLQNEGILIKGARKFGFENIVKKLELMSHGSVLEINLSAVLHNLSAIKSTLPANTQIMAMVKAFAYGSGSYEIAKLIQKKVNYFAVAFVDEGIALRQKGIKTPIMVLNVDNNSSSKLLEFQLEPVVYSLSQLQQLTEILNGASISIHIEIDSGMHRLGFMKNDLQALVQFLTCNHQYVVKSVFSHLSASDEAEHDAFTQHQYWEFNQAAQTIEKALHYPVKKHISNTAAIFRFPNQSLDLVRLGIGLYGINPTPQFKNILSTVFTLKTSISQIKNIAPSESIGYSRQSISNSARKIAILALGYADGLNRKLSNGKGGFYINSQFAPIVGNVCMDMCMVDISQIQCQEGDEAELFGKHQSIESIAKLLETIPYEVLTSVSQRVKRVYVSD